MHKLFPYLHQWIRVSDCRTSDFTFIPKWRKSKCFRCLHLGFRQGCIAPINYDFRYGGDENKLRLTEDDRQGKIDNCWFGAICHNEKEFRLTSFGYGGHAYGRTSEVIATGIKGKGFCFLLTSANWSSVETQNSAGVESETASDNIETNAVTWMKSWNTGQYLNGYRD